MQSNEILDVAVNRFACFVSSGKEKKTTFLNYKGISVYLLTTKCELEALFALLINV